MYYPIILLSCYRFYSSPDMRYRQFQEIFAGHRFYELPENLRYSHDLHAAVAGANVAYCADLPYGVDLAYGNYGADLSYGADHQWCLWC